MVGIPGVPGKATITINKRPGRSMSTKIQQGTSKSSWRFHPHGNSYLSIEIICNLALQTRFQEIKGSRALSLRSALCSEKMEKLVKSCAKGSFWQRFWWSISPFLPETGFILFFHGQPGPVFSLAASCISSWIPLSKQSWKTMATPYWTLTLC